MTKPGTDKGYNVAWPVLELRNVTKIHKTGSEDVVALSDADLKLNRGELVAVMGPSGSGKSTLLNVAGGLDTPTSGKVLIHGTDLGKMDDAARSATRRRRIGYVFQDYNLLPTLTLAENVALPLELDGRKENVARAAALSAMADLGIDDLADRFPGEVSRGQAQRAAIARAFVSKDRLLLADEPTGALDSNTAEDVMRLLRTRVDAGATGLLVTHETRFAGWADRVIFLKDGKISETSEEM